MSIDAHSANSVVTPEQLRLAEKLDFWDTFTHEDVERLMLGAADEIERLRSYLGSIAVHTDYPAVGCEQHMMEIARRALGMET